MYTSGGRYSVYNACICLIDYDGEILKLVGDTSGGGTTLGTGEFKTAAAVLQLLDD